MKTKKLIAWLIAAALMLVLVPAAAFAEEAIEIGTEADLKAFRDSVNDGTYTGAPVKLTDNITLTEENWAPIGNGVRDGKSFSGNAFTGVFDGCGYEISGLKIGETDNAKNALGLFGVVNGGTVKNLKIDAEIDTNSGVVGAAVGHAVGGTTVESITVNGSVQATDGVGGVVGRMTVSGAISNCTNNADVTATNTGGGAGGIVGKAYYTEAGKVMTIAGCKNSGAINGSYAAGGVVALSSADIKNCQNSGAITAGTEAGGIVGEQVNRGTVSGNTNSGKISNKETASGTNYGGIIGWVRYQTAEADYPAAANEVVTVSDNKNSGVVSAPNCALGAGGIVGEIYNQGTVTGNENTAESVTGGAFAAGVVGAAQPESNGNVVMDGAMVFVSNNVSTTALDNITGTCKDLYMYNNDTSHTRFNAVDNNDAWVVEVSGKKFAALQPAIDAATAGQTVKVLEDIELSGPIVVGKDKDITLDLGTYSVTYESAVVGEDMITNNGKLTIEGTTGSLVYTNTDTTGKNITISTISNGPGGTLTVLSGTIRNMSAVDTSVVRVPYAIDNLTNGNGGDAKTVVKGGTVQCDNYRSIRGFANSTTCTNAVEISGGTMIGQVWMQLPNALANNAALTITGGSFEPMGVDGSSVFVDYQATAVVDLSVTGGTFKTKIGTGNASGYAGAVTGGTFTEKAKNATAVELIAKDYGYKETEDGFVVKMLEVAEVGGKTYPTLQKAIDAATAGQTVKLLENIELTAGVTVAADDKITLDLNGKVLSGVTEAAASSAVITNRGDLTIKDSTAAKDGKITAFAENPDTAAIPYYANNTITNCGTLTVESGTIENSTGDEARACYPVDNNSTTANVLLTVKGGKLTGRNAVRQFANSTTNTNKVELIGGSVEGRSYAVWMQNPSKDKQTNLKAELVVSGTASVDKILLEQSSEFKASITGGNVKEVAYWSVDEVNADRNLTGFITGGTFEVKPDAAFIAEDYEAKETEDGFVVSEIKAAAIGDKTYPTLQKAIDAVQDGETIKVLSNITITAKNASYNDGTYIDGVRYNGDKNFTIDFGGYTVTDDGCVNDYLIYLNNKGEKANKVTFKNGTITSKNGCWATVCVGAASSTNKTEIDLDDMEINNKNGAAYAGNSAVRIRYAGTTVNVNAETVLTSDGASYGICGSSVGTIVNIKNGATVTQKNSKNPGGNHTCAAVSGLGTINVYDGAKIESDYDAIYPMTSANPVVNVYGGTISGNERALAAVTNGGTGQSTTIKVSGGKITGALYEANADCQIIVTGGMFDSDVEEFLAEGYSTVITKEGYIVEKNLTKVTGLKAAAVDNDSIKLTWTAVEGATGYTVTDVVNEMTYNVKNNTYTVNGVTPGVEYSFTVEAFKTVGTTTLTGEASAAASCTTKIGGTTLTSVTLNSKGKPVLRWNEVPGAVKYEIFRSTSGTFGDTPWTSKDSDTYYVNTKATQGRTYYYKVRAIDAAGAVGSFSNVMSVTCVCDAPTISVANSESSGKPRVTWNAVEGAEKYQVYRATSEGGKYTMMYETTGTSYTNTAAVPGTAYFYKVMAICDRAAGNSEFSNVESITCDCARPVVSIKLSSKSGKPFISWSAVEGAEKYYVYRATSEGGEFKYFYTTTKTNFTNTGAAAGKTYYYKVKAVCEKTEYGNSAQSAAVSITSE